MLHEFCFTTGAFLSTLNFNMVLDLNLYTVFIYCFVQRIKPCNMTVCLVFQMFMIAPIRTYMLSVEDAADDFEEEETEEADNEVSTEIFQEEESV